MTRFDGLNEEEWKREVEALLLQNHTDIQRLWKRTPQFPRDWIGELPHAQDAETPPQDDIDAEDPP